MTKKIIIASAASVVLIICCAIIFFLPDFDDDNEGRLPIYYFNAAEGRLVAEFRDMPYGNHEEQVNAALRYFSYEPRGGGLTRTWPAYVEPRDLIEAIQIDDGVLHITFSEMYSQMEPLDEALFRSAFVLTFTALPYIDSITFLAGENEWNESALTIANNPFISPARRTADDFVLYFVDETGERLVATLFAAPDVNVHTRSQYILELLIEQQNESGILPLIPAETRVRDVLVELDAGIYVDLSPEFHSRFSGTPAQARLMLQAITHTMLENILGTPRRVFFLIDSERWEEFHGVGDFNLGFVIDESILIIEQ
jgi:hypothetical protein